MNCVYYAYLDYCQHLSVSPNKRLELFEAFRKATSGDGGLHVGVAGTAIELLEIGTKPRKRLVVTQYFADWVTMDALLADSENELAKLLTRNWRCNMVFGDELPKHGIVFDLFTNHAFFGTVDDATFAMSVIVIEEQD